MKRWLALLRHEKTGWIIFLTALPAYFVCRLKHFSAAGHLAHPDDLTPLIYFTEPFWIIGFILAMIGAFRSNIAFRYAFIFAAGVGALFIATPTGFSEILWLPLYIVLGTFTLACLLGWID